MSRRAVLACALAAAVLVTASTPPAVARTDPGSGGGWSPLIDSLPDAHWDPCRIHTYMVMLNGTSPKELAAVRRGFDDVSAASRSIKWAYQGTISGQAATPPARNFADPGEPDVIVFMSRARKGRTLGYGGASASSGNRQFRYGEVIIYPRGRAHTGAKERSLYQHEVGHVMGLGHTGDHGDVMFKLDLGRTGTRGWTTGLQTLSMTCQDTQPD